MQIAEKLWDLENATTGFAVLQALAMTFALGKGDFRYSLRDKTDHLLAFKVSAGFAILYLLGIWFCYAKGRDDANESVWFVVSLGQSVTIMLFNVVMWGTLYKHFRTQHAGVTPGSRTSELKS